MLLQQCRMEDEQQQRSPLFATPGSPRGPKSGPLSPLGRISEGVEGAFEVFSQHNAHHERLSLAKCHTSDLDTRIMSGGSREVAEVGCHMPKCPMSLLSVAMRSI